MTLINKGDKVRAAQRAKDFLERIARGEEKRKAAIAAGYTYPERDAYPILLEPQAVKYMKERLQRIIQMEAAPEALRIALEMLRSPKTRDSVRWSIAQTILAYGAGMVAPKAGEEGALDKQPQEMTRDELRAFVARAEEELSRRALPAPVVVEHTPQTIDDLL